jgi:glycosyltransferase involved in cell wall biosynthesis
MRPLIYSTSPLVGSGYASATRYVAKGLRDRGHSPAVFAWNSHAGQVIDWDGIPIYPRSNAMNGADGLSLFARHFGADLILAICDPWVIHPAGWRAGHDLPVVHWYPCQSEPASSVLVDTVKAADLALCYSQWGTRAMREAGSVHTQYCPLGVATDIYKPADKSLARSKIQDDKGVAGRFLAVMLAANSSTVPTSRKAFDQVLQGWRLFLDEHDPDALLYLHTWPGPEQGGFNLERMVEAIGLLDNIRFPDATEFLLTQPDTTLARIFAAADVAVQCTTGEGFGLPILEAQACGVPVLTTDYSSMPELTAHGLVIPGCARMWAPAPMEGWVVLPDPRKICDGLAMVKHGQLTTTPEDGRRLAESLSWDRVLDDHLLPALGSVVSLELAA